MGDIFAWISPHNAQNKCDANMYVFVSMYRASRSLSDTYQERGAFQLEIVIVQ